MDILTGARRSEASEQNEAGRGEQIERTARASSYKMWRHPSGICRIGRRFTLCRKVAPLNLINRGWAWILKPS
nr:hypothetical protein [uncultured Campylobacter sp.]